MKKIIVMSLLFIACSTIRAQVFSPLPPPLTTLGKFTVNLRAATTTWDSVYVHDGSRPLYFTVWSMGATDTLWFAINNDTSTTQRVGLTAEKSYTTPTAVYFRFIRTKSSSSTHTRQIIVP